MAQAMAPAELSVVRDDGNVHFGDMVQLAHAGPTASVLAADIHDAVRTRCSSCCPNRELCGSISAVPGNRGLGPCCEPQCNGGCLEDTPWHRVLCWAFDHRQRCMQDRRTGQHACAATASPQARAPCARNTLLLAKYHSERLDISTTHYEDSVLRYGQKIRVIVNPAVKGQELDAGGGPEPLCLFSKPVGPQHFAKYSHHQVCSWCHHTFLHILLFAVVSAFNARPRACRRVAGTCNVQLWQLAPCCTTHVSVCTQSCPYTCDRQITVCNSIESKRCADCGFHDAKRVRHRLSGCDA